MRHLLSLVFGLAAVVGFETMLGCSRWQSFDPGRPIKAPIVSDEIAAMRLEWARPDGFIELRAGMTLVPLGGGRVVMQHI